MGLGRHRLAPYLTLLQWERGGWHKVPPEPILEKLLATYLVFIKVGRLFDPFTVGERGWHQAPQFKVDPSYS